MMSAAILVFWQRYGLTAMLGLAALGCLGAIGFESRWGQAARLSPPTTSETPRTPDVLATLPDFTLPSLDNAFKESAERPLFTPSRRPPALNLAANVPAMKKGQFKLSGTSVNNGLTIAFLVEAATGKTVRVTKGKEINGITLDTVEANRVVLKQGEETEELTLRTASSPPAPKVTAPAPGAPGPAVAPPVASVNVGAAPPAPSRPAPPSLPQNPLVAAPGYSQLPGFVMQPGAAPAQAAPADDNANAAQRRRRFQTPAPQ